MHEAHGRVHATGHLPAAHIDAERGAEEVLAGVAETVLDDPPLQVALDEVAVLDLAQVVLLRAHVELLHLYMYVCAYMDT